MSTLTGWTFHFHTLDVSKAQEDGALSNGDEPYFIFFQIRSTFNVPGSTKVSWRRYINDNWASGIDTGGKATIPREMGELIFDNVKLLSETDISNNNEIPELIGFIGVSLESDNTRDHYIINLMNRIQEATLNEFQRLIENGEFDITNPAQAIQEATQNIQKALELSITDKLTIAVTSFGDPDDFIGVNSKFYLAGDSSVKEMFSGLDAPIEFLEDNKNLKLDFEGDGAHYLVSWDSHALT